MLEKLSARIKRRQTIRIVKSQYDGAIPSDAELPITVDPDDVALFWTLLDYTAVSFSEDAAHQPIAAPVSISPGGAFYTTVSPESNNSQIWNSLDTPLGPLQQGATNISGQTTRPSCGTDQSIVFDQWLDWDTDQGFNTNWSFLGRPWAAYTSSDSWFALN